MKHCLILFFLISTSISADENISTNLQINNHPKINIARGGEGGGGSVGGEGNEGSKITIALSEYDKDMIAHGVDCANSVGANLPEKKTIDSIVKAIEFKITSPKASRSIASEPSQSCHIFSSQTTSVILKRKYIHEEVSPANNSNDAQIGNSISK